MVRGLRKMPENVVGVGVTRSPGVHHDRGRTAAARII